MLSTTHSCKWEAVCLSVAMLSSAASAASPTFPTYTNWDVTTAALQLQDSRLSNLAAGCRPLLEQKPSGWRDCLHETGIGKQNVLHLRLTHGQRGVTDASSSKILSIQYLNAKHQDELRIVLPNSSVKAVFSECNVWTCSEGKNIRGEIRLAGKGSDRLVYVDVRTDVQWPGIKKPTLTGMQTYIYLQEAESTGPNQQPKVIMSE